jgi:hypothetical protein
MEMNTLEREELLGLETELQEWLELHKDTNSDPETEAEYRRISQIIQDALMSAKIMDDFSPVDRELEEIIRKAALSNLHSNELRRIFADVKPTALVKEELEGLIAAIDIFLLKHEDASNVHKQEAVHLGLKEVSLGQKTYTNIEILFEKNLTKLQAIELAKKEEDLLSPKLKFIPFKSVQDTINGKLSKLPKIGKFFGEGHLISIKGYPIRIKLSLQGSGDIAFFPTKFQTKQEAPVVDDVVLSFFRQTNAYQQGVKDLKTSLTTASAAKVIDLGFAKLAFKLDLLKFASSISEAIANKNPTIAPLSVNAQFKIDKDSINWFNDYVHNGFSEQLGKKQAIISLQLSASINLRTYLEGKLIEAIEEKLKKKQSEIFKNAETIADDLVDGNPSKRGKKAAKALKNNSKILQELGEEAAEQGAKEVREKVLKETGESVGKILLKKVGKTVLTKFIPGLNVVSTLYDLYQVSMLIWDMYKKSLQTDYIWIKVRATGTTPGFIKFVISSIYLKKDYYEEFLLSHDGGEALNSSFPYEMKIEISLTNCTSPAILEKEEDGDFILNNCFPMSRDLLSDQVAEEFMQWFNKGGSKISDIKPQ